MKIEFHDGIRIVSECSEEEYMELLRSELNIRTMGKCEICHYHEAICRWISGKLYCKICRDQELARR